MFRAAIHMKFKFQIWRAQTSRCTLAPCLNVSTGWLKDVNQHDNCSNNIIYYQIYISNNTAILEGVSTTVFMLVLYYTVCCRLFKGYFGCTLAPVENNLYRRRPHGGTYVLLYHETRSNNTTKKILCTPVANYYYSQ